MAIVNYLYYQTNYHGTEATQTHFAAFEARAEDVVGSMTRWKVSESTIAAFPAVVQDLVKKAVCSQIDYFAVNGFDSVAGGTQEGFTVGKVSVHGGQKSSGAGAMSGHISPLVLMYLEQTGLLAPQVETMRDMPEGWWP